MAAVSEIEESAKLKKLPPLSALDGNSQEQTAEYSGLGIATALHRKPKENSEPVAAAPSPVVVQVGNTNAPTGSPQIGELERLALYVIKGDEFLRDSRKRTAFEMLRASADTDEEYNVLVARLEQAIAVKTKVVEENSGVNKLARFAFDKLTTLLRGE